MTLRTIRSVFATLVILSFAATAPSQAQGSKPEVIFGHLLEQRLDVLAKDSSISARAHGKRGMALMEAAGDSALYFMDDEGLRQLAELFAVSAVRATPAACASLYLGGQDAFPQAFASVIQSADSALIDRWTTFMVRLVRVGIMRPPIGDIASATQVGAVIRRLVAAQSPAERPRLQRGAAKTGDVSDICFFTVTLYRQLGGLAAKEVGPVFRAMMRGVRPSFGAPPA
ncbi:MAG TPA: hypothetical protein VJW73_09825 [Gemmatimonadaceae bacterium]|nr:hypothetical protein [Gemmatimonadaceae bacterium]